MDVETFLLSDWEGADGPALYIVGQTYLPRDLRDIRRCGASGTKNIGRETDGLYRNQLSSLNSRLSMYKNFWLPGKATIYAYLTQPKRRPTAKEAVGLQGTNMDGTIYNIEPGDQRGVVLVREKLFHKALDDLGLRWDPNRRNELFKGTLNIMLQAMRSVPGLKMFLCENNRVFVDDTYDPQVDEDDIGTIPQRRTTRPPLVIKATPQVAARLTPDVINQIVDMTDEDSEVETITLPPDDEEEELILVPSRGSTQHLKDALQDGNLKKVIAQIVKDKDVDLVIESPGNHPITPTNTTRQSNRFHPFRQK